LGFIEATTQNGMRELEKKQMIVLFPEGEYGNFKPSVNAYQLQDFKRGFVRMAIKTGAPIIPTMVIGAEETHINLSQFKLTKFLRGLVIPLPLNVIPLPSKWKIKFLKPIYLPYKPSAANNAELVREIADDIREQIQDRIRAELKKRKKIFF
jgi:1-acyl-sn-glycerol-3-phosphate acyltransferase